MDAALVPLSRLFGGPSRMPNVWPIGTPIGSGPPSAHHHGLAGRPGLDVRIKGSRSRNGSHSGSQTHRSVLHIGAQTRESRPPFERGGPTQRTSPDTESRPTDQKVGPRQTWLPRILPAPDDSACTLQGDHEQRGRADWLTAATSSHFSASSGFFATSSANDRQRRMDCA